MKHKRQRLPIPQHEFGFTPETFRLFSEHTQDGERIARERAEADEARRLAAQAQSPLFTDDSHE